MLLEQVAGQWKFRGTKYKGEPLDVVALKDPAYVRWAWAQLDLTDEEFYALSDCLDHFGIPRNAERR